MFKKAHGFTIVELLIVIVIIAILAAVTVVVYRGMQNRAAGVVLLSDLRNAANQLGVDRATGGSYPLNESLVADGNGFTKSPGTSFLYASSGSEYCLSAISSRSGVPSQYITSNGDIDTGVCEGHTDPNLTPTTAGQSWTAYTPGNTSYRPTNIAYGNGVFVAIRSNMRSNIVITSTDGINWVERTIPRTVDGRSITYGNGRFVMLGQYHTTSTNIVRYAFTSTDGVTWNFSGSSPSSDGNGWWRVAYGNGVFVAVGQGTTARTSTDGLVWTAHTIPSAPYWDSMTFGNGRFVATTSSINAYAVSSTDGQTWTGPIGGGSYSIAYGNGLFIRATSSGVYTSTTGISGWTKQGSYQGSLATYGGGRYIVFNGGNQAITSTDGSSWNTYTVDSGTGWSDAVYGKGCFIAVRSSGTSAPFARSCE